MKKSVTFTIEAIDSDPGLVHYASPRESDGDAQQLSLFMDTDSSPGMHKDSGSKCTW